MTMSNPERVVFLSESLLRKKATECDCLCDCVEADCFDVKVRA